MGGPINLKFSTKILHNIKALVLQLVKYSNACISPYSQKPVPKTLDWLVRKNGCANFIHPWVVDATQLESARPIIN